MYSFFADKKKLPKRGAAGDARTGRQDPVPSRANSPQFRGEEASQGRKPGTRTARKETGSSALQQARTRAREEKRKQKGRGLEERRGPHRTSWRMSGRRGRPRRRRPVAGSRGGPPPAGAVAGGVGRSETWGGWGVRACVGSRAFVS